MLVLLSLALGRIGIPQESSSPPQAAPHFEENFESAEPRTLPAGWIVPTKGFEALVREEDAGDGKRSLELRFVEEKGATFGNCMRAMDAAPYAGQRVLLTALVRVESEGEGRAQMWLRVDCPGSRTGAFDNMSDRPIRPGWWEKASIAADVDADGLVLNFGFMSFGHATVDIDDVELRSMGPSKPVELAPPRPLSARGLENLVAATRLLAYVRFFEASDASAGVKAWDHFAVAMVKEVEDARDSVDLARRLGAFFAPVAPTLRVWAGSREDAPPLPSLGAGAEGLEHWEHHGAGVLPRQGQSSVYHSRRVQEPSSSASGAGEAAGDWIVKPLAEGVFCRWSLAVACDGEGTLPHAKTPRVWASTEELPNLSILDRSTRLAGVGIAWGVFRHFYPYFDVVGTDWDAALPPALEAAAKDSTESGYVRTLRELVAKLHDGHGRVQKIGQLPGPSLPIRLRAVGSEFVVTGKASAAPAEVEIGDVLVSIAGRPVEDCCKQLAPFLSATTEGRERYLLAAVLPSELATPDPAPARLRHPDGREYDCALPRGSTSAKDAVYARKPANGAEVAPGIVYFDLNGTDKKALESVVDKLDAAEGIVFDLRGYPSDAAVAVLGRLIQEVTLSAQWCVPVITRPDGEGWTWETAGRWNLNPVAPRWAMPVAFLTDASAISYAESIMGIVEAYKLGAIVGSTTAGTNGNVNPFVLPGNVQVSWTGMKVLKNDGSPHHGVGIAPTVPIEPTAEGIAEGRDEVLEMGVEVVKAEVQARGK